LPVLTPIGPPHPRQEIIPVLFFISLFPEHDSLTNCHRFPLAGRAARCSRVSDSNGASASRQFHNAASAAFDGCTFWGQVEPLGEPIPGIG
jgi:hypothetical protein